MICEEERAINALIFVKFYNSFMGVISEILRINRKMVLYEKFYAFSSFPLQAHTKDNQNEMH